MQLGTLSFGDDEGLEAMESSAGRGLSILTGLYNCLVRGADIFRTKIEILVIPALGRLFVALPIWEHHVQIFPIPAFTQASVPFIRTVLYIDNAFSVFCWFASPPCPHRYLCLVFRACKFSTLCLCMVSSL